MDNKLYSHEELIILFQNGAKIKELIKLGCTSSSVYNANKAYRARKLPKYTQEEFYKQFDNMRNYQNNYSDGNRLRRELMSIKVFE